MKKTYFLVTLGCPKNEIDSEAVESDLVSSGMAKAADSRDADLVIVNSCGFINDAKIESIHTVLDLHQDRKPGSVFVMCGCLPARYSLSRSLDEVDIFLPWNKHQELVPRLQEIGWQIGIRSSERHRMPPRSPFGYLRISEGCDNRCAYCAIPDIKGPFTSRPLQEILDEAHYLCDNGVRELVLIGQDTTLYGKSGDGRAGLGVLIDKLSETSCEWIRLMYAHPAHLNEQIIDAMAGGVKIVKYLDLPLQHISDRLLGKMNRKVTRSLVERLISELRRAMPEIVLRTTFIVGFPGETDSEFEELLDFCESREFDNVGIFKYSPEEGTPAYNFRGRLEEAEIEERYLTLLDVQNMISEKKLRRRVNSIERVLLQSFDSDGRGLARGWFQAPEVDGSVIVENCLAEPGNFVDVVVERSEAYDLFARQIEER